MNSNANPSADGSLDDADVRAMPSGRPEKRGVTVKFLLSVIALALLLIALRPFVAPSPAQAQDASVAAGAGTSIVVPGKEYEGATALVSYNMSNGQHGVAVLVYGGGQWSLKKTIVF